MNNTKQCPNCGYNMEHSENPNTELEFGCAKCGYGEDVEGKEIILT